MAQSGIYGFDHFSAGCVFPGECYELKRDLQNIFKEELDKACQISSSFRQCFEFTKVGTIFCNKKKLASLISKSKL